MSEHTWFQDNLAAYCAGGLTTDEAERLGRHRVACGACAKMLADAQRFDGAMESLFAPVRPEAGWENRVIEGLRAAPKWRRRRWSALMRVATSAAAVVLLGVMGAVLYGVVGNGKLTSLASKFGILGEVRTAQSEEDDRAVDAFKRNHASGQGWGEWEVARGHSAASTMHGKINHGKNYVNSIDDPALLGALINDTDSASKGEVTKNVQDLYGWRGFAGAESERPRDVQVAAGQIGQPPVLKGQDPPDGKRGFRDVDGSLAGEAGQFVGSNMPSALPADGSPAPPRPVSEGGPADVFSGGSLNNQSERLRVLALQPDIGVAVKTGSFDWERSSETHRLNNVIAMDAALKINDFLGRGLAVERNANKATGSLANDVIVATDPRTNTLIINAPQAQMAAVKKLVEELDVPPWQQSSANGRSGGLQFSITGSPAPPPASPPAEHKLADRLRDLAIQPANPALPVPPPASAPAESKTARPVPVNLGNGNLGTATSGVSKAVVASDGKPAEPILQGRFAKSSVPLSSPPVNRPSNAEYFKPPLAVAKSDGEPGKPTEEFRSTDPAAQTPSPSKVGQVIIAGNEVTSGNVVKTEPAQDKQPAQPEQAPEAAARKIIRTGAIEFEVDSFDSAVGGVTKIVNNVKGGFVATVNSDKLPNGKVKGSIVVRMPPEKLDKFLLDVRLELGKTGELKSQRIGSQDVTKQYTDVESRLRGARAMEERFIQIIKTGKGEIKDLIVAENALGVWRTKIEEMEGEIRYYNNQVGLSTLTITLVEKEIQAPASLVVTERVKMQLEVDDVEKARDAALTAVTEAKGRVTKSELKQHAAGQLEAILHFEIAPAAASKTKDRLKQLGIISNQTADRIEQSQGAGSRVAEIKLKQSDVKFEVAMYNVANIQPREVLSIQIGCLDVAVSFKKLQEAALKAKAQVRNGQLNEQDKANVTAQLDIDVPTPEKKTLDQAVGDAGTIMSRTATQAGPGEAATDRKVGYRLVLRMAPTVTVTERQIMQLEVDDVDKALQAAKAAVAEAGGRVTKSELQQLPAGQLKVFLNFEIAPAAADQVRDGIRQLGIVTHQTSDRTQQGDGQAADVKTKQNDVKFEVTMYNTANVRPREELVIQIASLDVPASFKKLQDAVIKSKGQVRAGQLNEQDKVNVSADLNFDIPVSERKIVDQALAEVGKVLSRTSSQVPPGEAATDRKVGYRLTFRNVATVAAREKEQFAIEVKDVDQAVADVADIVKSRQGRVSGAATNHLSNGQVTAVLECDLPLAAKDELIRHLKSAGNVRVHKSARNPQVPDNELATAHFEIALATSGPIVPSDEGLWPQIRSGLYFGFKILAWSLVFVIIGFMAILPWLMGWLVYKMIRGWRRKPAAGTVG